MKDMFDCLEEDGGYNCQMVFLTRKIRNKRGRKSRFLYLQEICPDGSFRWGVDFRYAINITPRDTIYYEAIKKKVRDEGLVCFFRRVSFSQYLLENGLWDAWKPVKKETWWSRFKVWFSRKIQYFAGYISIERAMKD